MTQKLPSWIGSLITLTDCDGDSEKYIEKLFEIFKKDFIESRPVFNGKPVLFDKNLDGDKPNTFVHITTETDPITKQRILSMPRCERIGWLRQVIDNNSDSEVLVWEKVHYSKKKKTNRVCLYLECGDYLVILDEQKHGFYIITGIYVDYPYQKKRHRKEFEKYSKNTNSKS